MVRSKPHGSKMKSVPSISQQYEAPILQYDDETAVYENHRYLQSVQQQPAATSVGYPPLNPRSNQKVFAYGLQQQPPPHRQTLSQPQYRYQQSMELPQPQLEMQQFNQQSHRQVLPYQHQQMQLSQQQQRQPPLQRMQQQPQQRM